MNLVRDTEFSTTQCPMGETEAGNSNTEAHRIHCTVSEVGTFVFHKELRAHFWLVHSCVQFAEIAN